MAFGLVVAAAGPAVALPTKPARFQRPVAGPIVDHFRPPACRWCAGNRGIDFAASPGEAVHAVAGGTVSFAGAIGDDRFVVVALDGPADLAGLRVTYGYVAEIHVGEGDRVARGQSLAIAAGPLHVGLRRNTSYLDPEPYFAAQVGRVHLVRI